MNLSLGAILTVEVIFAYVIWGQELAEELSAIRPTHRSSQQFDLRGLASRSNGAVEMNTVALCGSCKVITTAACHGFSPNDSGGRDLWYSRCVESE